MSANRQLKRHHACHECRTKKLKCSGDRPICDGCKRKQDHHTASGSRRPVPECTYDFAPGEEVWVHWPGNVSNTRPITSKPVGKRTPSPPRENKPRRSRTPTKPPMQQLQPSVTIQRPTRPPGPPLSSVDLPEGSPYQDPFSTHFNQYSTFLASGLPYPYNSPVSLNDPPHSAALAMGPTMNESFFAVGPHGHYLQAPASMSSPDSSTGEYTYPTTPYPSSLPNVTLLSNGIIRWM